MDPRPNPGWAVPVSTWADAIPDDLDISRSRTEAVTGVSDLLIAQGTSSPGGAALRGSPRRETPCRAFLAAAAPSQSLDGRKQIDAGHAPRRRSWDAPRRRAGAARA